MQIRCRRQAVGLSITEVAKHMGVAHVSVIRWEQGKSNPTADKLPKLADLLGCSIAELYGPDPPADGVAS